MRKTLVALGFALALGFGLTGCTQPPPVTGVIDSKYIENFTEFQVVMVEDGTGTVHHFEVEEQTWHSLNKGDKFSNRQQPGSDD